MERRDFLAKSAIATAGAASIPMWLQSCGKKEAGMNIVEAGSIQDMEALFKITKGDMKKLISAALSNGGEHADLFFEYRVNSSIRMEEDIIKDVSRGIVMGMGVRVIKGEQIGYAYTDEIDFEKMKQAALTSSHIASGSGSVNVANLNQVAGKNLYQLTELSIDSDLQKKLKLIDRANIAAKQYDPKVSKTYVSLADEMKQIMYFDSTGNFFTDVQPMLTMRTYIIAEDGDKRQGAGAARCGRVGMDFFDVPDNSPETNAKEAAQIAVTNLEAVSAPAGPQVVVLGPGESGVLLHEAVGHGLEADFNRKDLSNYSGQVGNKVASEHCTIIDAGIHPNLRGSINVDDEGNLPTESVLIEKGILRGYMHDNISSKQMNLPITGNGRRQSYNHPPIPRMTATYMRGGKYDPTEVIKSVKSGVYAKRFGGGQVDITKGDFTFGVYEGYLIEDGKLTAPLKDLTLIGNGPEVMRNVTMVGNDPTISKGTWTCGKNGQRVPVSVGIPTTKVSEITVGGTKA